MVSGLTGKTYAEKCKELGLDTLEERRLKQDMLQTYKICNGKDRIHPDLLYYLIESDTTQAGKHASQQTHKISW